MFKTKVDSVISYAVIKQKESFWTGIKKDLIKYKYIYLMLLPVLAYYIVFHYIPMGGTVIAFQDYKPAKGFLESDWVGLKNFVEFLTGPYIGRLLVNTILINFYQIIFAFPAPIILALMINEVRSRSYKNIVQTISYLPNFISLVVVCGLVITFVQSDGIITNFLVMLGLERQNLLTVSAFFRPIYVSSGIWQFLGWGSIIYLSTLSNVDTTLYEAAVIDGAGRFKQIIHVTIPAIIPIIVIQLIMRIGHMLGEGSEKVLLLYNPLIFDKADIISTYVYRRGLLEMSYSFASAVGVFNSIINLSLLIFANWFSRRYIKESLW